MNSITDTTTLNNGVNMPWLGFGVFQIPEGEETYRSVRTALDAGYRSIDTAAIYGNEVSVGRAIRDSGIAREEIFVTTKVWNSEQGYESTLRAFDASRKRLQLDTIDLYLVHWPVKGRYVETWRAMEQLYQEGKARAVGVSNFLIHHIQDLLDRYEVVPTLNQIEYHPLLQQPELHRFCEEHGVQLEAWAPLMQGQGMSHPVINEIARAHGKSAAQVLIRWDLEKRVVTIPKSVHAERIVENGAVFDFALSPEELARIAALDENRRIGPDPDHFDF